MTRQRSIFRKAAVPPLLLFSAILTACPTFNKGPSGTDDGPTVVRVPYSGDFSYEVDAGDEERDVFFTFSASALYSSSAATVKNLTVDGTTLPVPTAPKLPARFAAAYGTNTSGAQSIADYNAAAISRVRTLSESEVRPSTLAGSAELRASDTENISISGGLWSLTNSDTNTFTRLPATCRKVVGPFTVADGKTRTLSICVQNTQWTDNGGAITQTMVDALADKFLVSGLENDIYDWLTNILGAEWGTTGYTNLISFTGEITIFLADIDSSASGGSSAYGGIIGYFYSGNNFTDEPATNQRIMFVIDAPMYANSDDDADSTNGGTGVWSADGYWPKETFSTLAHEFQHMIHFYQKAIVAGVNDVAEVWIDEFCAQLAEDLLADKMEMQGPRGVSYTDGTAGSTNNAEGRIPFYNQYTYLPLTIVNGFDLLDYSTVYAFGSWAARNYGGSEFLRRVVQSPYADRRAVETAAAAGGASPSDLDSLIGRWAVAVMNSDRTDMPAGYRTNGGDWFTSTSGTTTYRLGSIDYFNYLPRNYLTGDFGSVPGPVFYEEGRSVASQYAGSNVYYAAARNLVGSRKFSISLPEGVTMHLVLR